MPSDTPFPMAFARRRRCTTVLASVMLVATACDGILDPSLPSGAWVQFFPPVGHVVAGEPVVRVPVRVMDATGNRASGARGIARLRLQDHPSGAKLVGGTVARIEDGRAVFREVAVDRPARDLVFQVVIEGRGVMGSSNRFSSVEAPDLIRITNRAMGAEPEEVGLVATGGGAQGLISNFSTVTREPSIPVIFERSAQSNEVVVFQRGRAPGILSPAPWTVGVDTVEVSLEDPLSLPISVWLIAGGEFEELSRVVEIAFRDAQAIFDRERAGLDIVSGLDLADATGFEKADRYAVWPPSERNLYEDIGLRAGRINLYGVDSILAAGRPVLGMANYPTATAHISASASGWNGRTVAHELGHLFGFPHTGDIEGFREHETNLMGGGGSGLTEGQVFSIHFNDRSAVNRTYGLRSAHARRCPNDTVEPADPRCLPLNLRLWPDPPPPCEFLLTCSEAQRTADGGFPRVAGEASPLPHDPTPPR